MKEAIHRRRALRTIALMSGIAIAMTGLAGCSTEGGAAPGGKDGDYTIAFIPGITGISFYNTLSKGIEDKAKELGMKYSTQGAAEWGAAAQTPIVDAVCGKAPDLLIITPTDPVALRAPIDRCMDSGIKVITVDTHLDDAKGLVSVLTSDDKKGGELAAKYIGDRLGGEGTVAIQTFASLVTLAARSDAAHAYLEKNYPNIKVLADQNVADDSQGASVTAATIVGNPDVDAFFNPGGLYTGITQSIKAAEDGRERFLVAYNAGPDTVEALKAGDLAAIVTQTPAIEGAMAAQYAFDALSGKDVPTTALVPPQIITSENVNDPDIQKYLDIP